MPENGLIYIQEGDVFVQIENWDDILKRPNFVTTFDPTGKELVEVIGHYSFKEQLHCCLTNCNQPHNHGYLVLTSTGEETYVGNICGKKIFGDIVFSSSRKNYKTNFEINHNRNIIIEAKSNLGLWYDKLIFSYNRSPQNARWAWENLNSVLNPAITGSFISSELGKMKHSLNGRVVVDRFATEKEIEILKAQGKRPPYLIEIYLGEIKHVSVLSQADELKKLVLIDIKETLEHIDKLDPINCDDYNLLKDLAKKTNSIESNFRRIDDIVQNTIKFLNQKNLQALYKKLSEYYSNYDKNINIKKFQSFIESIQNDSSLGKIAHD